MTPVRRRMLVPALAGAVAVAVAIGATMVLTGTKPGADQKYCAELTDAVGLYPGNSVTQMGVRIGTVDTVEATNTSVRVGFTLDDRTLPATVQAITRSTSILTDRSLEMVGNYTAGPELEPGRCITMDRTATAKSISQITAATADLVNGVSEAGGGHSAARLIAALTGQLTGNGAAAGEAVTTAGQAAADPERAVADLTQMLQSSASLVAITNQRWDDLDSAFETAPEGMDTLAKMVFPAVTKIFQFLPSAMSTVLDLQLRNGKYLYPGFDAVTAALHLAATNTDSMQQLAESLPGLATALASVSTAPGDAIPLLAPRVRVGAGDTAQLCALLNTMPGSCAVVQGQAQLADVDVLQLVLRGGVPR